MKNLRLFLIVTIIATQGSILWSQEGSSNEILVYVKPNTIEVPLNQETNIRLSLEQIKSTNFLKILQNYRISKMTRAFANFNLTDTLKYSPEGEPIVMLDLSRLFKIVVPSPYNRDSLIASLSHLTEVIYAEKNGG